jgi:hypothetical protein
MDTFIDPSRPELFLPSFAVLWCAISGLLSIVGGWAQLASAYRSDTAFSGAKWRFQSAGFRYVVSYNSVLTIGYGSDGIHFAVFPLFRVLHPPLLIPWNEIVKKRGLFGLTAILRSEQCPSVPISISSRLLKKIEAAAQRELPRAV